MHRVVPSAIAALLLLSPALTQAKKASKQEKLAKPRMAILEFPAAPGAMGCRGFGGNEHRMANVLRDLFTSEIMDAADGKIRMVERERLAEVRGELDFQQSGEVDGATAQKVGKLLGVRYLLTGKMTRFACKKSEMGTGWGVGRLVGKATGSSFAGAVAGSAHSAKVKFSGRLDVRLIDTQSGEILATLKDENETGDQSVKIAGGGNEIDYDDELASRVFEPIVEKMAPKLVKKCAAVHEENLASDAEEEDEEPVSKRKGGRDEDEGEGEGEGEDEGESARGKGTKVARAEAGRDADEGDAGQAGGGAKDKGAGKGGAGGKIEVFSPRFDFVPGEKVLYFDDFSDTSPGEYPERWTNGGRGGAVEVVASDGKHFLKGLSDQGKKSGFNSENFLRVDLKKALPEKFTVELDMPRTSTMSVVFSDKIWATGQPQIWIEPGKVKAGATNAAYQDSGKGPLRHVSIAISKTNAKVYIDGERVLINPDFKPEKYVFRTVGVVYYVYSGQRSDLLFTNFKLAEGGKDYAKDLAMSGRIVTHGITFDSGSDRIRPESGPTLRNILKLLQDDSALAFEVEGHTDNQGGDATNGPLSERRAGAVKAWLVSQGIADSRLSTKGLGASKPLEGNDTPEGRANNRRVEFVKKTAM